MNRSWRYGSEVLAVEGDALVGPPLDHGQGEAPAVTQDPIAGAAFVAEPERRLMTRGAGGKGQRDPIASRAGVQGRLEGLTQPFNRPGTLGQRNRVGRNAVLVGCQTGQGPPVGTATSNQVLSARVCRGMPGQADRAATPAGTVGMKAGAPSQLRMRLQDERAGGGIPTAGFGDCTRERIPVAASIARIGVSLEEDLDVENAVAIALAVDQPAIDEALDAFVPVVV